MMRHVETAVVGFALAVLAAGFALAVVTAPPLTAMLVDRVGSAELAGLHADQAGSLAEEVRAYVTRPDAPPLPGTVYGRPGFDREQVSHLDDVRSVLAGARTATYVAAVLCGAWLGALVFRRRMRESVAAMRVAGVVLLGVPALAAVGGLFDFDTLFAGFHGLFFEAGTWTFAPSDLLIQLFPERFWIAAGVAWGGLIAASGMALLGASALLGRRLSGSGRAGQVAEGT